MLITVVNHEHNAEAVALSGRLAPFGDVVSIDSGSKLEDHLIDAFDLKLPNVYYTGLLNVAVEQAVERGHDELLFICSDVSISDCDFLVAKAREALADDEVGCFAPCVPGSPHLQMRPRGSGSMREVAFVEGMCFAARIGLLRKFCPVDTKVNLYGYGLDVVLGYHAMKENMKSVVDDRVRVHHPRETGYDTESATAHQNRWLAAQGREVLRFNRLTRMDFFQTRLGFGLLRKFYWG